MTRNFPYDSSTQTDSLDLINDLCYLLYKEKINYCHWKSNSMIDRSAKGENDLDLLVSHSDIIRFANILFDLGFKQAVDPSKGNFPGIVDYFGLDRCSGKLVHVHAHYCLVLGHDYSKNYHLPIEEQYLATSFQCGLFRLPLIEFEFILFILRMVLKHSNWETILIGQRRLSTSESQELEYFKDQISFSIVSDVLQKYIPKIKIELFMSCIQVIDQESSLITRIKVGHQLQAKS